VSWLQHKTKWPPDRSDPAAIGQLVEAAGQLFHTFRCGLDYAFIPVARDAERVIRLRES
jgi:hypothetical protein